MNPQMQRHLEKLLLAERDRASADLNAIEKEEAEPQLASGGGLARRQWNKAEFASDVQEQETDFINVTRISAHLAEIDEALRLLANDPEKFGHCEHCGDVIEAARLQLVPWSRLCSSCSRLNGQSD